jgi:hypothetical protein
MLGSGDMGIEIMGKRDGEGIHVVGFAEFCGCREKKGSTVL